MGRLTTHVLDTAHGRPAGDVRIDLYALGDERRHLANTSTNADGRCEKPLLDGDGFRPGTYELVFQAGAYFAGTDLPVADPPFLDEVVIRFAIADGDAHYHVPLLLSPWSYSTYRGS